MSDLFKTVESGCLLKDLPAAYAIDCSGSTAGSILRYEIQSASMLSSFVQPEVILSWHTSAKAHNSFDDIRSQGGTDPSSIIPFLQNAKFLILYTDGQISTSAMERFHKLMKDSLSAIPIIVIFTMNGSYSLQSTIQTLQSQVDMSIPEACLALSNDACVVVNISGEHKVLMASGAMNMFGNLPTISSETKLETLIDFDMSKLTSDTAQIQTLPPGCINLNGFKGALDLEVLYQSEEISQEILEVLSNRIYFAKLDTRRMHQLLSSMLRRLNDNPVADNLAQRIAEIAVDPKRSGGPEHIQLLEQLKNQKNQRKKENTATKLRSTIQNFLELIAEYNANKTTIAFGSNRANRAKIISNDAFADDALGDCIEIPECPIYLESGPACILLTKPKDIPENISMIEFCTNNIAMEAPFHFGSLLKSSVTPGIYCLTFAKTAKTNPYTREKVLGFIPFSKDPVVVMNHMARIFCESRELWHMVRAYISMMVSHCHSEQWAQEKLICEHLQCLLDTYVCTYNLMGSTEDRRPLRKCFEYVTENYATCLRSRIPNDVLEILKIVNFLMPEWKYSSTKIEGMVNVMDKFSFLLRELKQNVSMMKFVMELDEYGHCVREKFDLESVIARLFWIRGDFQWMKLQTAVENALQDKKFGGILRSAFIGEAWEIGDDITIVLPEPSGEHFGPEKFSKWTKYGRPLHQCVYCGETFPCGDSEYISPELICHLTNEFGDYYFSGQKAVREVLDANPDAQELTKEMEIKLFKQAKELLFSKYGEQKGALHTQHCKRRLLHFLHKFFENK